MYAATLTAFFLLTSGLGLAHADVAATHREADRQADRAVTEALAELSAPGAGRSIRAAAFSEALAALAAQGQNERAYGLARAAGVTALETLGPATLEGAILGLRLAQTYEAVGQMAAAEAYVDYALPLLTIERPGAARDDRLAEAVNLKASLLLLRDERAAARALLGTHPYARRFANAGRLPATDTEFAYLAARILSAAMSGDTDAEAAARLAQAPDPAKPYPARIYRAVGQALGPGDPAQARGAITLLGLQLLERAEYGGAVDVPGVWYRPTGLERMMAVIALLTTGHGLPDGVAFALMQMEARRGDVFAYDALAAMSRARTLQDSSAIRRFLRLKARRDNLERASVQAAFGSAPADPAALARAQAEMAGAFATAGDARLSGADLVGLTDFQSVLRADEAALMVTSAPGRMTYLCVRADRVEAQARQADTAAIAQAIRLMDAALTAGHAPSERLDSQFPVEAAMRLHAELIAPFRTCLKPGDRIIWLSGLDQSGGMLAATLAAPPPRTGDGYDLSAADWLIRRHAVSYAGTAGLLYAVRTAPPRTQQAEDFLGVGDPVLAGLDAAGQVRQRLPPGRGADIAALAPLPETADELKAVSELFPRSRLLLGAEATEAAVRPLLPGDYRYMSFATHGLLREDLQGLSDPALVLTPDEKGHGDGLLTATEIADLDLRADFVALSACNTANFDLTQAGQDLTALASAFALAGTPSTLATLWPVESEAGKQVVTGLFRRIGAGPAQALAEAQLAFLAAPPGRAYLHPRFWAPFVILGDGAGAR